MRTLGTQVRLRRLIRAHAEAIDRLSLEAEDPAARSVWRRRLLDLIEDARRAWSADLETAGARGGGSAVFDTFVRRSLRALEATVAEYGRAAAGDRMHWLAGQFNGSAVPLLLFLRGLEETPAELLDGWLTPALAKSA